MVGVGLLLGQLGIFGALVQFGAYVVVILAGLKYLRS